ncbi:MAG: hypothetical protein F6J97_11270 [Leptolyngbya sp. SIO4C1]|nr:hypothetical protein [Leptolyngbya sp. SIO4C1]
MRRLLLLMLAMVGAFSLSSCNFFNRGGDTDVAEIEPVEPEAEVTPEENTLPPVPADSNFAPPAAPGAATVVAPELIRSTNPNERAIGVQRGRSNPFASLPIPPTPEPVITSGGEAAGGGAGAAAARPGGGGGSSPVRSAANTAPRGTGSAGAAGATPVAATAPTPVPGAQQPAQATPAPISPLPAIPQPDIARAVRVSGVVQINGSSYAIVQVPNEVERYVRAGERIANGRVLVKRIDTRSIEPRVVLEQNGIEVAMSVTGVSEVAAEPDLPPPTEQSPQATLTSTGGDLPVLEVPGS